MNPRNNYEMTDEDYRELLDACKPTPAMWGPGGAQMFSTPQENANRAWAKLGKKMGFDPMTAQPVAGKSARFFTAVPSETEEQQKDRLAREDEIRRQQEVVTLRAEIADRQARLRVLDERSGTGKLK